METTGAASDKKDIIAGTDEVRTTTSADSIAAAPSGDETAAVPVDSPSLKEHTKDLAAKAMMYIEQYGMLAGAIAVGTAAAIIIARKIISRRKK